MELQGFLVNHSEQFIAKFRIRCQDLYIQECFRQIEKVVDVDYIVMLKRYLKWSGICRKILTVNLDNVFLNSIKQPQASY